MEWDNVAKPTCSTDTTSLYSNRFGVDAMHDEHRSERPSKAANGLMPLCIVLLILAFVAAMGIPAWQANRESKFRRSCANNLKTLSLAIHNYHGVYRRFPPAYLADSRGKPMHSWRVLLLPFLGEEELYRQYDFQKPWDSPENLRLTDRIPAVYRCPSDTAPPPGKTRYVVVVGNDTAFVGRESVKLSQIRDGTSNTIMFVESNTPVTWLAPIDLRYDDLSLEVNSSEENQLGSPHPAGMLTTVCDGSVRYVPDSTNKESIKALLTRSGGEPVPPY